MRAYVVRRLLLVIPTLLLVSAIVFFSIRLIPGDVVDRMVEAHESMTGKTTDLLRAKDLLRAELGLDLPVYVQYGHWIGGVLRGDLGNSLWTRKPVSEELLPRFPVSFELGVLALIVAQLIALPIGIYSAIRQDTVGDYIGRSLAILCIALPSFWIGTLVMVFPAIWWNWSPSMEYIPFTENPIENLQMFMVPAVILGMVMSGTTMRMTRTMMLEVLRQDYIRTAWAKGLKERAVVLRHALKNALIPVVTIIGMEIPVLIGGSVILENIFNLPGIGRLLVEVINNYDYPILSAINLVTASVVLLANVIVDLTYAYLDPRVHYK